MVGKSRTIPAARSRKLGRGVASAKRRAAAASGPTEVELLLGDPSKARKVLGWKHEITFPTLVKEMVASDLKKVAVEGSHNS